MRHKEKNKILGRKKAPREMMLRNLASSIFIYEKITTTESKAKAVKPMVEKIITLAKEGSLNARRSIIEILPQKLATKKLMDILGARYKERKGGYTRVVKLGTRQGDGALVARIELV